MSSLHLHTTVPVVQRYRIILTQEHTVQLSLFLFHVGRVCVAILVRIGDALELELGKDCLKLDHLTDILNNLPHYNPPPGLIVAYLGIPELWSDRINALVH